MKKVFSQKAGTEVWNHHAPEPPSNWNNHVQAPQVNKSDNWNNQPDTNNWNNQPRNNNWNDHQPPVSQSGWGGGGDGRNQRQSWNQKPLHNNNWGNKPSSPPNSWNDKSYPQFSKMTKIFNKFLKTA